MDADRARPEQSQPEEIATADETLLREIRLIRTAEVIPPSLVCPKCRCGWGGGRMAGEVCGDALWKFGRPDLNCDGFLETVESDDENGNEEDRT